MGGGQTKAANEFKMELEKAIISISSKKREFFVSAFHHKLIFGPAFGSPQSYKTKECFEIDSCDYHKIYVGLFPIAKFLSGKSQVDQGELWKKDLISYKWKISDRQIILNRTDNANDENQFSIKFTELEFNDLVYLLSEVCFLSLNLDYDTFTVFTKLSKFELKDILTWQSKEKLKNQLQNFKSDLLSEIKFHCLCELVYYNLDIIVCVHKLRLFHNENEFICHRNIKEILECENVDK